jgi:hypothetical protein
MVALSAIYSFIYRYTQTARDKPDEQTERRTRRRRFSFDGSLVFCLSAKQFTSPFRGVGMNRSELFILTATIVRETAAAIAFLSYCDSRA